MVLAMPRLGSNWRKAMKADPEAYERALRDQLLTYFRDLAQQLDGATDLGYVEPDPGKDGGEYEHSAENAHTAGYWALDPTRAGAAEVQWHLNDSGAYSTYVQVARTWIEVMTTPKQPVAQPIRWVEEIVAAAVAGRFEEHEWYSKRTGKLIGVKGYIQYHPDEQRRTLGYDDAPLPLLRKRLYIHKVRQYAPYL